MKSIEKLRKSLKACTTEAGVVDKFGTYWITAKACDMLIDEIEAEIERDYMLKNDAEIDKTAVQEYNLTVHVADGQTIEYNTELRHRCGAATSMSVAFRLE